MKFAIAIFALLISVTALAAQGAANPKIDPEVLKKLQGTWEIVTEERDGQPTPPALIRAKPTITFTGDTYRWGDGQTGKIVAIDASKKPIWIDYMYTSGDMAGLVDFAIIQIDGDTFMDCMSDPQAARPTQFSSIVGNGRTLMTYRRVSEERGPGMLLNPAFYVGLACALGLLCVLFTVGLVILVIWLSGRSKSGQTKEASRRPLRRDDRSTDGESA